MHGIAESAKIQRDNMRAMIFIGKPGGKNTINENTL
jgi:hypothetical protein